MSHQERAPEDDLAPSLDNPSLGDRLDEPVDGRIDSRVDDSCDDDLIGLACDGDREAAAIFLFRHKAELLAWCRQRLRPEALSSHDPDDLLSTLLRRVDRAVMQRRFKARNQAEASRYLFAIAGRALKNVFRRNRAQRSARRTASSRYAPEARPAVDLERIRLTIAELEGESYELLVAKLDGRNSTELAERFGVTSSAVRKRLEALRERLSRELGEVA